MVDKNYTPYYLSASGPSYLSTSCESKHVHIVAPVAVLSRCPSFIFVSLMIRVGAPDWFGAMNPDWILSPAKHLLVPLPEFIYCCLTSIIMNFHIGRDPDPSIPISTHLRRYLQPGNWQVSP